MRKPLRDKALPGRKRQSKSGWIAPLDLSEEECRSNAEGVSDVVQGSYVQGQAPGTGPMGVGEEPPKGTTARPIIETGMTEEIAGVRTEVGLGTIDILEEKVVALRRDVERLDAKMLSEWKVVGIVFAVLGALTGLVVLALAVIKWGFHDGG